MAELHEDASIKNDVYNKPLNTVPKPKPDIGVDTDNQFFNNIINAGESSQLDIAKLQSFTQISQSRDSLYTLLDTMAQDSTISAIIETYAEDATERNDSGNIVWVESSDDKVGKYVTYLLDTLRIDKQIYSWAYSLCKYGDLYVRLYRKSEIDEDPVFKNSKEQLNEAVNVKAYAPTDKYAQYIEMVPNPAEMFELTRFGKTQGYIQAPITTRTADTNTYAGQVTTPLLKYQFKQKDINIYEATEFVHAYLADTSSRVPETVDIFMADSASDSDKYTYTVNRGQSILYNMFKIWRERSLLEQSVLLNRLTKSSIVRIIGVEVGDMPKHMVGPHLQGVKSLIEQKSAISDSVSMSEYTNPGPVENNIYVPIHDGVGSISSQQIGGDVDVKSLADLDYFTNKFYASAKVPKQYFGETDDAAGFNGGSSLSIISSRYAKTVKRVQNCLIQIVTDILNLILVDRGLTAYINNFTIKMLPPTTQEEIDRQDNMSSKVQIASDIINLTSDVQDPVIRLKILKSLVSSLGLDNDVVSLIQDEIDVQQEQNEDSDEPSDDDGFDEEENFDFDRPSESRSRDFDLGGSPDMFGGLTNQGLENTATESPSDITTGGELPAMQDLDIDFTDNNTAEQ